MQFRLRDRLAAVGPTQGQIGPVTGWIGVRAVIEARDRERRRLLVPRRRYRAGRFGLGTRDRFRNRGRFVRGRLRLLAFRFGRIRQRACRPRQWQRCLRRGSGLGRLLGLPLRDGFWRLRIRRKAHHQAIALARMLGRLLGHRNRVRLRFRWRTGGEPTALQATVDLREGRAGEFLDRHVAEHAFPDGTRDIGIAGIEAGQRIAQLCRHRFADRNRHREGRRFDGAERGSDDVAVPVLDRHGPQRDQRRQS